MFYKDIKLDDNQFELLLCNFTSRKNIIRTLRLLIYHDPNNISGLEFYRANRVKFDFETKPEIIAGIALKIQDKVIDGSMAAKLEGFKKALR